MKNKKEVAIQLSGVKKMYKLGQIGGGTLRGDLESWWARVRGKTDPNTTIGQEQRLVGQTFMALNGIDLTVYKGEALGIIGANGAGKSTMLKLLSRVTAPTEGTIDIYGRIASMLEVGTGFNGEMTGRENVYMNGAILGMSKAEIDAKMEDIIEFSEVREFIDTPVKRYSSGMYVKLAFSVAAHLDSEIMIMDEVLAVGDMSFQKKCLTKMREAANRDGRTVLYVSHNMNTIRQLCNRCIVLNKGRIIFDGDVEEAINLYLEEDFNDTLYIDYSNTKNPAWLPHPRIKIISVSFLDRNNNVFRSSEEVVIRFLWRYLEKVSGLCLRIEVLNAYMIPVGTYLVYEFDCGLENETKEIILSLDVNSLVDGNYHTRYVYFTKNEFGNNTDLGYEDGLSFTIQGDNRPALLWKDNKWGNVILPSPIVKTVKENY